MPTLAFLLLRFSLTFSAVFSQEKLVFVDLSAVAVPGDGSLQNPYISLETAISAHTGDSCDFFIISQDFSREYELKTAIILTNLTRIRANSQETAKIQLSNPWFLRNSLEIANLTLLCAQECSFFCEKNASLRFFNVSLTNSSESRRNCLISLDFALLFIEKSRFQGFLFRDSAVSLVNARGFSEISAVFCDFKDFIAENASFAVISAQDSRISLRNVSFLRIFAENSSKFASFLNLSDCTLDLRNCRAFSSNFSNFLVFASENPEKLNEIVLFSCDFLDFSSFFGQDFLRIAGNPRSSAIFSQISFKSGYFRSNLMTFSGLRAVFLENVHFSLINARNVLNLQDSSAFLLKNCTFSLIFLEYGSVFLENVVFKRFSAVSWENCSSFSTTPGITVFSQKNSEKSFTIIANCRFVRLSLEYIEDFFAGAALFLQGDSENVLITGSYFSKNSLKTSLNSQKLGGPCARLSGKRLNISIESSLFFENRAMFDSSCLQLEVFAVFLKKSAFSRNIYEKPPKSKYKMESAGFAGAISATMVSFFSAKELIFAENMNYFAGAVYISGFSASRLLLFSAKSCVFLDNYSHSFGGGLFIAQKAQRFRGFIENCVSFRDWANFNGAFSYFSYDSRDAFTKFFNNIVIAAWSDFGSALSFDVISGQILIESCSFINNTASFRPRDAEKYEFSAEIADRGSGAAIGIYSAGFQGNLRVFSKNNAFSGNLAKSLGGAIIMLSGSFHDINSRFYNNFAENIGVLYAHMRSTCTFLNTIVVDTRVSKKIAAISVREFSNFSVNASFFARNAAGAGEGLFYVDSKSQAAVFSSFFEDLRSSLGVLAVLKENLGKRVLFLGNTAVSCGNSAQTEMFFVFSSEIFLRNNSFFSISAVMFRAFSSKLAISQLKLFDLCGGVLEVRRNSKILVYSSIFAVFFSFSPAWSFSNSFLSLVDCDFTNLSVFAENAAVFAGISATLAVFRVNISIFSPSFLQTSNSSCVFEAFSLENSLFSQKSLVSALKFENPRTILARNCTFRGNFVQGNGSCARFLCSGSAKPAKILLKSCVFLNNSAELSGGAVFCSGCDLQINSSFFLRNIAKIGGGAVYFSAGFLSIFKNRFEENTAREGGAIKYEKSATFLQNGSFFLQNFAVYGENIASFAIRLDFSENSREKLVKRVSEISFSSRPSVSQSIFAEFSLVLKDFYGQTVSTVENTKVFLAFSQEFQQSFGFFGEKTAILSKGRLFLNNTAFFCDLSLKSIEIFLKTPALSQLKLADFPSALSANEELVNSTYSLRFPLYIQSCFLGEIYDKILRSCVACGNGSYTFRNFSENCQLCPKEALFCNTFLVFLKPGVWKSSAFSEKIYECRPFAESCLGGTASLCAQGYRGPLCQSCEVFPQKFAKSSGNICVICSENTALIASKLGVASVFLILVYVFTVFSNIKLINTIKIERKSGEVARESKSKLFVPIYSNILLNYFQVMALIKKINLEWSSLLKDLFYYHEMIGNVPKYLYSFECLMSSEPSIPFVYLNVVLIALTPFVFVGVLYVFFRNFHVCKRKSDKEAFNSNGNSNSNVNSNGNSNSNREDFHQDNSKKSLRLQQKEKIITSCLVILTILQPNVVDAMVDILSCMNINDRKYLIKDPFYQCDGTLYLIFTNVFAIPSFVLWVVSPFFLLLKLKKRKNELKTLEMRKKYGYLYNSFKLEFYFWQFIEVYKKYCLILIINFLNMLVETTCLACLMVLFFYALMLDKKQPYFMKELNKTAFFSEISILITLFLGLFTYILKDETVSFFCDILIILLNSLMLIFVAKNLALIYRRKLIKFLTKNKNNNAFFERVFNKNWFTQQVPALPGNQENRKRRVRIETQQNIRVFLE